MKLLKDRILVKKAAKEENKTEAGIILGNKPKNENDFEVLILGNDVKGLKVGAIVRKFQHANAIPVDYNDEKCYILCESSDIEFVL